MLNPVVSRVLAMSIAAGVVALDRWSKWLVETRVSLYDSITVIPGFFNIIRSENPGVAFGMLADGANRSRTVLLVAMSFIAISILGWMLWKMGRQDRWTSLGISLIFGGAIGNVYDRVIAGRVTDFLDFYAGTWHWYTFNLADSAIFIGAVLVGLMSLKPKPREANA
jgi:signal peptidase II